MISSLPNQLTMTRTQQPAAAATPAPTGDVEFSINQQDSTIMSSSTTIVSNVGADVSTGRVKLLGGLTPNSNGTYVYGDKEKNWTAANSFAAVANTVALAEKIQGKPIEWAFSSQKLGVTPDAGEDFNAYYARQKKGLFFFHNTDPVTKEVVFSGNSAEVTGHEAYHAILDGKRPNYLGSWSPDPGAFHESIGDVGALLTTLHDPSVLDLIMSQTGGDLSKQNASAALGEQLGIAINHYVGKDVTGGPWTRNAINTFTWQDPSTLPSSAPPDQLSREVHSLSRLWTGAIYDVLKGVVSQNVAEGQDPRTAIANAADDVLKMQFRLLEPGQAPDGSFKFKDMAKALVKSENELNGGKYTDLIKKVMDERKILPNTPGMLEEALPTGTREVRCTLEGDGFGQFAGCEVKTVLSGQGSRSFTEGLADQAELQADLKNLIAAGEIKMTMPNEDPGKINLIKADGEPYKGVVRWTEGKPVIEPTYIAG